MTRASSPPVVTVAIPAATFGKVTELSRAVAQQNATETGLCRD